MDASTGQLFTVRLAGATLRAMTAAAPAPFWYDISSDYLGVREYDAQHPGPNGELSNPIIERWQKLAGIRRPDDQIPWCGAALTGWLHEAGLTDFATSAARAFSHYGRPTEPRLGCIVVLWRDSPSSPHGHVGLWTREDATQVWVRGGNENNSVTTRPYPRSRILTNGNGYRWPTAQQLERATLDGNGVKRSQAQ